MIVGNVAVVDQRRAIVVDARIYSGGCLVVGIRLARADPAAHPRDDGISKHLQNKSETAHKPFTVP